MAADDAYLYDEPMELHVLAGLFCDERLSSNEFQSKWLSLFGSAVPSDHQVNDARKMFTNRTSRALTPLFRLSVSTARTRFLLLTSSTTKSLKPTGNTSLPTAPRAIRMLCPCAKRLSAQRWTPAFSLPALKRSGDCQSSVAWTHPWER